MAVTQVPVADWWQEQYLQAVGRVQPVLIRAKNETTGRWETTGEQDRDLDGVPLWTVTVNVDDPDRDLDLAKVKVASAEVPDVAGKVAFFVNLRATYWSMAREGGEASGLSLRADAVMLASDRPSSGRAAVGAPPRPPAPSKAAA